MEKKYTLTTQACRMGSEKTWSRKNIHLFGLTFIFIFFASSIFSQTRKNSEQDQADVSPWQAKGMKNELVSKRTRTSKHFVKEDNSISAFISPASLHYLNVNNSWEEIDNTIVPNSGSNSSSHPYVSEKNAVQSWFPKNPNSDYIVMKNKEGAYKERVSAIKFLDANKSIIGSLPLSNQVSISVNENKILYSGLYPNMSLEYSLGSDGRKFDLIISSASFFNAVPSGAKYLMIEEVIVSDNSSSTLSRHDDAVYMTVNNTEVLGFEHPVAYDATESEEHLDGELKIVQNNQSWVIQTNFQLAWLQSGSRNFPLHLDPTVSYYPTNTSFWTGYQTSSLSKVSGYIRVASTNNQGWGKFDLTTLPLGATVTQATYFGYHYTTTSSTKFCEVRGMGSVDPVSSSASAIFTQIGSGNLYDGNYTYGGSTYTWNPCVLGGTALSDIASAAGSWIGLGFRYSSGSTTFMYHYGINGYSTSPQRPCYLEVIYFTVPCTVLPSANAVLAPTFAICPGSFANLSLANTYSVGGITYQWQSSTLSAVGPFAAISGATNAVVATPTLNQQTWFNVLITCTSVVGFTSASSAAVMVEATTTNSIPYAEGFENIQAENVLPNCSWSCVNLGSTALTYKTSNTLGRVPHSGNSFASFYYSPAGTKEFYTNGLQLSAGITYSVGLWYVTDYYGYSNWSDLSILIAPGQSTVGQVTIASTTGPATSNVYKEFGNTFTVGSSGIYYISVRATSAASGAQYLSWDDLEVTVPCSLNSPSLTLTTSATTLCANGPVILSAAGAISYLWNTGATTSVISEMPLANTLYYVVGTSLLSGCSTTVSQQITVKPSPEVLIIAHNQTVCQGSPANLTALGPLNTTYVWSNNASGAYVTVYPTTTTNYTVLGTNSFGCVGTAVQAISVDPLPSVSATSSQPNEMCAGEIQTLTFAGGGQYQCISNTSAQVAQGNPININPSVTTIYSVTGTDANGCSGLTTITQIVSLCTGVSKNTLSDVNFFPNPTNGQVNFQFGKSAIRTLDVTDVSGKLVFSEKSISENVTLNLTAFSGGIYFVKIKSDASTQVIKIVKQ